MAYNRIQEKFNACIKVSQIDDRFFLLCIYSELGHCIKNMYVKKNVNYCMKNHFGFRLAFPQHAIVCPGNLAVKYHLCSNVNWITILIFKKNYQ